MEKWSQFIRLAVIAKDPQPRTAQEREILKREICHENTTFPEVKTYLRQFSNYIQSGNDKIDQIPERLVFEIASNNADSFWIKMFEGWGFCEKTTLQEFIKN